MAVPSAGGGVALKEGVPENAAETAIFSAWSSTRSVAGTKPVVARK